MNERVPQIKFPIEWPAWLSGFAHEEKGGMDRSRGRGLLPRHCDQGAVDRLHFRERLLAGRWNVFLW